MERTSSMISSSSREETPYHISWGESRSHSPLSIVVRITLPNPRSYPKLIMAGWNAVIERNIGG